MIQSIDQSDIWQALHTWMAQGGGWQLADMVAAAIEQRKPDAWQTQWVSYSGEPDAVPPVGYVAHGPWEPYAATETQDGWKRPLKRSA